MKLDLVLLLCYGTSLCLNTFEKPEAEKARLPFLRCEYIKNLKQEKQNIQNMNRTEKSLVTDMTMIKSYMWWKECTVAQVACDVARWRIGKGMKVVWNLPRWFLERNFQSNQLMGTDPDVSWINIWMFCDATLNLTCWLSELEIWLITTYCKENCVIRFLEGRSCSRLERIGLRKYWVLKLTKYLTQMGQRDTKFRTALKVAQKLVNSADGYLTSFGTVG